MNRPAVSRNFQRSYAFVGRAKGRVGSGGRFEGTMQQIRRICSTSIEYLHFQPWKRRAIVKDTSKEIVRSKRTVNESLQLGAALFNRHRNIIFIIHRYVDQETCLLWPFDLLHERHPAGGYRNAFITRALHCFTTRSLGKHIVANRRGVPLISRFQINNCVIFPASALRPDIKVSDSLVEHEIDKRVRLKGSEPQ